MLERSLPGQVGEVKNFLIPGKDFNVLVPIMEGGKAVVNLKLLGEEFEKHQLTVKEAGVVAQLSVESGPREWAPRMKWPEGFIEIAKLRTYTEDQAKKREFQSGYVYAVVGFIPNSSPFLSEKR